MAKRNKLDPPQHSAAALDAVALRAMIESTDQPIAVIGLDGQVLVWNRGIASVSGLSAQACIGRPAAEVLADIIKAIQKTNEIHSSCYLTSFLIIDFRGTITS